MVRVAVLGANGQVGSEICLLLSRVPGLELVPVCRNRSGSAFLRWQGIACRHGRPAESTDASRLFADCDLILNFALASGNPAQIRLTEDNLIRNSFACSRHDATVVYFSTQSVYGDPSPGRRIRWKNPYGRAKLVSESRVLAASRKFRKPAFILRLGHVCGELQGISLDIRRELRERRAILPTTDVPSNTVLTVAIVDAIDQVRKRAAAPGVYDLMNTPQWTWREVYRYESERCGLSFEPTCVPDPVSNRNGFRAVISSVAKTLTGTRWNRDVLAKLLAHAPPSVSQRAQAAWYIQRARAEISAMSHQSGRELSEHLYWVTNGRHSLPQTPTVDLLRSNPYVGLISAGSRPSWPADLPDAAVPVRVPAPTVTRASG